MGKVWSLPAHSVVNSVHTVGDLQSQVGWCYVQLFGMDIDLSERQRGGK